MSENTPQKTIFKADLASSIKILYIATIVFLILLMAVVTFTVEMIFFEKIIFYIIFTAILILFLYILYRADKIKYIITSKNIEIKGPLGNKKINIEDIETTNKTVIPTGLRLFGASFLGGWYYLPGVGKTWVAMSNFKDGVLIKTKNLNIVITPKKHSEFIDTIKKLKK